MEIRYMNPPWKRSRLYQLWRFFALNLKIIKGVYHSKRLPDFVIKYKISYVMEDDAYPDVIANTAQPPQVGSQVDLGRHRFEITEIGQILKPNKEFCFLQAKCRFVRSL